jgi:hypothetical protein
MTDPAFPECCSYCPYRRPVSGACDHDLRQSLISYLDDGSDRTCPVFSDAMTAEMRGLQSRLDA